MSVFDLWLPILLAGLAVHIASTLAWVVLPHHKPEWKRLDVEDEIQDWLDAKGVAAGQYLFPHTHSSEEMASPEFKAKMEGKCRGMLVLWPKPPSMGVNIGLTILFFMLTSFVIGYLASNGVAAGAEFMNVFQFTAIAHDFRTVGGRDFYAARAGALSASNCSGVL